MLKLLAPLARLPLIAIIAVGLIGLAVWHSLNYVLDRLAAAAEGGGS